MATICSQLKMKASDGKMRKTDVADIQGIVPQNGIIPINRIYYSYFVDVVPIR